MIPRLTRFYGQSPDYWAEQAPMARVRACLRMMPVLIAEEALRAIDQQAVGAGRVKRCAAQAYRRTLVRQSQHGRPKRERRAPQSGDIEALASLGIKTVGAKAVM